VLDSPKGMTIHSYNPLCVLNVVFQDGLASYGIRDR